MEKKRLTRNVETGKSHTAKWPTIIAAIFGCLALVADPILEALLSTPAVPVELPLSTVGLTLLGMAGLGLGAIAIKNRTG